MTKAPKAKAAKKKPKLAEIELQPDAWDRFEKAVGIVASPKRKSVPASARKER